MIKAEILKQAGIEEYEDLGVVNVIVHGKSVEMYRDMVCIGKKILFVEMEKKKIDAEIDPSGRRLDILKSEIDTWLHCIK